MKHLPLIALAALLGGCDATPSCPSPFAHQWTRWTNDSIGTEVNLMTHQIRKYQMRECTNCGLAVRRNY